MIIIKPSDYDALDVSDDGTVKITVKVSETATGLGRLWSRPRAFPAFLAELERQGYTSNGQWIGTDRELRALFEFLKKARCIPDSVSLPRYFRAVKETFSVRWAHENQIKRFSDFEYEVELARLHDIFGANKE